MRSDNWFGTDYQANSNCLKIHKFNAAAGSSIHIGDRVAIEYYGTSVVDDYYLSAQWDFNAVGRGDSYTAWDANENTYVREGKWEVFYVLNKDFRGQEIANYYRERQCVTHVYPDLWCDTGNCNTPGMSTCPSSGTACGACDDDCCLSCNCNDHPGCDLDCSQ